MSLIKTFITKVQQQTKSGKKADMNHDGEEGNWDTDAFISLSVLFDFFTFIKLTA